jgi:hypothetical protein
LFPRRRLDDRIRAVCAKIEAASDGDLATFLQELLKLVHEKNERLKSRAAKLKLMLNGQRPDPERRTSGV